MIVESTAPIRSDVEDALAHIHGKQAAVCYDAKWEECFYDDFDFTTVDVQRRNRRGKKFNFLPQAVKTDIQSLNFRTRQRLEEAVRGFGKNAFISSDFLSRLKAQDDERNYAKERIAANTCARLERLGVKRKEELEPAKSESAAKSADNKVKAKPNYAPKKREKSGCAARKARWSEEQKEERVRVPHEYELRLEHVEQDDPEETNLMCFLLDLQNRDMTPEDYDMLLRLDDKLAPKTVAADTLTSLRTVTVTTDGPSDDEMSWSDALCSVCMEAYQTGQVVKFLPCEHFFHSHCIEMWLNNSGNTCPLDGLEVS